MPDFSRELQTPNLKLPGASCVRTGFSMLRTPMSRRQRFEFLPNAPHLARGAKTRTLRNAFQIEVGLTQQFAREGDA